jgi:predicted Zn-dependent protease
MLIDEVDLEKFFQLMKLVIIITLLFAAVGCSTVPITGRQQLNVVPNSEIIPLASQSYREVINESKLSTNSAQTAQVKRVGDRIKRAAEQYFIDNGQPNYLSDFQWEFNLIESDEVNAWCMPGGKVAFYTGILPICANEAGIAAVMGHEVAHAIANHGGERMSKGLIQNFGMSILGSAFSQNPTLTKEILYQSVGGVSQIGMLAFSRNQETEADKIGLIFMAMAGYDPQETVAFWGRMQNAGGQSPPEFLSTHPSGTRRQKDLNAWMPEAMDYYRKSNMGTR